MLASGTVLQGRYRILELLGRGGVANVYRALDSRLDRLIAIKQLVRAEDHLCEAFRHEARLLSRLRHQRLPIVSDYFVESGAHYMALDYIAGETLGQVLVKHGAHLRAPQALPEVLRWLDQLLDVLGYLHSQQPQVIHRDIKPANIKLSNQGLVLIDFGLATGRYLAQPDARQDTDETVIVDATPLVGGTPPYVPPGQLNGVSPDARDDLYALAASFTHILTGLRPPDAERRVESFFSHTIDPLLIEVSFPRHVPAGLVDLLYRAMSLRAEQRPSAASMLHALHVECQKLERQRSEGNAPAQARASLRKLVPKRLLGGSDGRPHLLPVSSPIWSVAYSLTGRHFAAGCKDGSIIVWLASGHEIHWLHGHSDRVGSLAFSPSGDYLASVSDDKTVRVWRLSDGSAALTIPHWPGPVDSLECVAYRPDGHTFAVGGWSDTVAIWLAEGHPGAPLALLPSTKVHSLAFSPDGKYLAVGGYNGVVVLWSLDEQKVVREMPEQLTQVLSVAFSPDGNRLAAGSENDTIVLWTRQPNWRRLLVLTEHQAPVRTVLFDHAGEMLFSASEDGTIRRWDARQGHEIDSPLAQPAGVTSIALSPDGQTLLSGSHDGKARLWRLRAA
jgi:WD40 repeat protein